MLSVKDFDYDSLDSAILHLENEVRASVKKEGRKREKTKPLS
jgi:hypothetical protein